MCGVEDKGHHGDNRDDVYYGWQVIVSIHFLCAHVPLWLIRIKDGQSLQAIS
jgi:hypothetical protein